MAQLNNTTTGETIRIDKIKDSGIYYSVFENTMYSSENEYFISKVAPAIDETFIPSGTISIADAKTEAAMESILSIESLFEINEDEKNWCIETGSTGGTTTLRILVPNEVIAKEIASNSDFGNMLIAMRPLSSWAIVSNHCLIQYLEELLDPQKTLIEAYAAQGVIIEYKI